MNYIGNDIVSNSALVPESNKMKKSHYIIFPPPFAGIQSNHFTSQSVTLAERFKISAKTSRDGIDLTGFILTI